MIFKDNRTRITWIANKELQYWLIIQQIAFSTVNYYSQKSQCLSSCHFKDLNNNKGFLWIINKSMISIFLTNKYSSNKGIHLFNILDSQLTSHKVNRCLIFYCRHLMPTITVMAMINMLILNIIWVISILVTTHLHIHNSPFSFQDKAIQWIILLRLYIWLINRYNHNPLRFQLDNINFSNIKRCNFNSSSSSSSSSNNNSNSRITIWMGHRIRRIMEWIQQLIIRKRMIHN